MKYLEDKFSVGYNSDAYAEGWDRIWGKKPEVYDLGQLALDFTSLKEHARCLVTTSSDTALFQASERAKASLSRLRSLPGAEDLFETIPVIPTDLVKWVDTGELRDWGERVLKWSRSLKVSSEDIKR